MAAFAISGTISGAFPVAAQIDPFLMGPDMLALLRGRAALNARRADLEHSPDDPVIGEKGATATLVCFSDYRCPYCRELSSDLFELVERTPQLRVVIKEWPIFGGLSVALARAALLAHRQGAYAPMHAALFERRPRSAAAIEALARDLGLAPLAIDAVAEAAIDRHLNLTAELAVALGLRGTPVLIAGERIVPGRVEADELDALARTALSAG
jgi:protein-disulfide isomerase